MRKTVFWARMVLSAPFMLAYIASGFILTLLAPVEWLEAATKRIDAMRDDQRERK